MRPRKFTYKKRTAEDAQRRQQERSSRQFPEMYDRSVDPTIYRPSDDNTIRILPPTWDSAYQYGLVVWVHWSIGADKHHYLCPTSMVKEYQSNGLDLPDSLPEDAICPICEERYALLQQSQGKNDQAKQALLKQAKEISAKKRNLVYLVDRDRESEGVQIWAMPWGLDQDIFDQIWDPRTRELIPIDDPDDGFDIRFRKEGQGLTTQYASPRIDLRHATPLSSNPERVDEWLGFAREHPLPSLLVFHSADAIRKDFMGGTASRETAPPREEEEEEQEKKDTPPARRPSKRPKGKLRRLATRVRDEQA